MDYRSARKARMNSGLHRGRSIIVGGGSSRSYGGSSIPANDADQYSTQGPLGRSGTFGLIPGIRQNKKSSSKQSTPAERTTRAGIPQRTEGRRAGIPEPKMDRQRKEMLKQADKKRTAAKSSESSEPASTNGGSRETASDSINFRGLPPTSDQIRERNKERLMSDASPTYEERYEARMNLLAKRRAEAQKERDTVDAGPVDTRPPSEKARSMKDAEIENDLEEELRRQAKRRGYGSVEEMLAERAAYPAKLEEMERRFGER